jgi:Spy/CpxP family protein refolding chaperone
MNYSRVIPIGLVAFLTAMTFSTPGSAEPTSGKGHMGPMMHDGGGMRGYGKDGHHGGSHWKQSLTKAQRDKLAAMKLDLMKKKLPIKAKMKVVKTDLALLAIADKPDMKAIDKKIDELTALKNQVMKVKYAHKVAVRKELTPEQRVMFDIDMLRKAQKGKKRGQGHHGYHH